VGATRFSVRLSEHLRRKDASAAPASGLLSLGAGAAGSSIVRELRINSQLALDPVGFVDDDGAKLGHMIYGIPVLGGRADIPEIAQEYASPR